MVCTRSHTILLPACPESLNINAGLQPNTAYQWELTTRFNITYSHTTTTDANGLLNIGATLMPSGLFMPFSGTFTFKVYTIVEGVKTPASFTIEGQQYDVMELRFTTFKTI